MTLMPFSKHDLLYTVLSPILMFSLEKNGMVWNCCISVGVFFVTICI